MNHVSDLMISVDLGTSSARACLVDAALKIQFQTQKPVVLDTDPTGKAVQDADAIIDAGLACISEALAWASAQGLSPQAISFSNAVASLVCLDEARQPLKPALTYADLRAYRQADRLLADYGGPYFASTATPVHASYWLPKFLWLRENDPDFKRYHSFCTIKDLFVYRLTGQFLTDFANAAATGMMDANSMDWDPRLLRIAGIEKEQLPPVQPTTHVEDLAPITGQGIFAEHPQLKVVLGANDGVLSSLGAGAFKNGQVTTMIGSSGACRIAADSPLTGSNPLVTWSYPLDEAVWIRGGAMNSGGLVTQWLVENFSQRRTTDAAAYEDLFAVAAEQPPGAEGLIFLPYLFGERAPIFDEQARGVFFGLNSGHGNGHFARAGLEGILFALYSIFEVIRTPGDDVEVRATGGYLRSALMLQIQADIFGVPIRVPDNLEGSAIGAATLAMKALGKIESWDEIAPLLPITRSYLPDENKHWHYQSVFKQFKALYAALRPVFAAKGGMSV
jgi:gluconokinase